MRDHDKIGKTICALANDLPGRGGGELLIGVNDDGTPTGNVDVSDAELRRFSECRNSGRILDRPSIVVDRAAFAGQPVIRVHVEAAIAPPLRFDGVVYVRSGPKTERANANDERLLAERRRANDLPYEMRPRYFTTTDDLDLINRAAILAADKVFIPLAAELFSLRGLSDLGPRLREWRD